MRNQANIFFLLTGIGLVLVLWGFGSMQISMAQYRPVDPARDALVQERLRIQIMGEEGMQSKGLALEGGRSIGLAFGLSAVLPGAGQAYNRHWVKAAVAAGIEAAIITGMVVWRRDGNELEDRYQEYAHAFWSPSKYARWLNDYSQYIQENLGQTVTANPVEIPENINFEQPASWTPAEWQQVNAMFDQIQFLERQMIHVETRAAFSHTLPDFSEQQYYELVGKYYQFAPGWSDYKEWIENGAYTEAIDPSQTGPGDERPNVSDRFFQYADDHAHANDVLRRASRISTLLIATHFVAAIEAAVSAKLHNDRLTPGLGMQVSPDGAILPSMTLRVKL